jgi:hypothetical protein
MFLCLVCRLAPYGSDGDIFSFIVLNHWVVFVLGCPFAKVTEPLWYNKRELLNIFVKIIGYGNCLLLISEQLSTRN